MNRIWNIIVQATPFCNINCAYCYLPHRQSRSSLDHGTARAVFTNIFASGWVRESVNIIWHAGEPLVMKPDYFRAMFALIAEVAPDGVAITHSINTNATLLDEVWCDFMLENSINLGVSIDGPRFLHDANRLSRSGKGTFDKAIAGVRLLKAKSVPFYVITVLGREAMRNPEALFNFYREESIDKVCFNVEEIDGANLTSSLSPADALPEARQFYRSFWNLMAAENRLWVREFHKAFASILRPHPQPNRSLVEPFRYVNVSCEGLVSTFSPELLSSSRPGFGDFVFGNLATTPLVELLDDPKLAAVEAEINAGLEACREQCEYFSVCGGGTPSNKLSETGRFDTTETMFCRLTTKAHTDLALEILDGAHSDVIGDAAARGAPEFAAHSI